MTGSMCTGIQPPVRSRICCTVPSSTLRSSSAHRSFSLYFSVTQARASISSSILFDLAGGCAFYAISEDQVFCCIFVGTLASSCHWIPDPIILFVQGRKESAMVQSLSLQDFLLRARVLKLYRHALRIARRAPDPAGAELRQTIRQEIENNRNCNDRQRIRFLLSDGVERVKNLDEMLDMQGH